jgi:hypothetical protein
MARDYYLTMNQLISQKWVDSKTRSIILTINFYNPTHDLFLTIRVLYENINPNIKYVNIDYGITDLTPLFNFYLILSIASGGIVILLMMLNLKLTSNKIKKVKKISIKKQLPFMERIKKFCKNIWQYFENNYRKPDFFEAVSKKISKNILYYFFYNPSNFLFVF